MPIDIEASLAVIAATGLPCFSMSQNEIQTAEFISAARDPITGWGPTLLELKEAREVAGADKLHLFYALKNAETKLTLRQTEACRACREEVDTLRAELKCRDEPVKCSLGTGVTHHSWTYCPPPCGRALHEGTNFCPSCGRPLDWSGK